MKRDVLVYLRGTQFMVDAPEEEEAQPIELVVPGTYTVQNDVELIEYDEIDRSSGSRHGICAGKEERIVLYDPVRND